MASPPVVPPSLSPQAGEAARPAVFSWRSVVVLRGNRPVSGAERTKALRHLQSHGRLPDGYTIEPAKGWAIDFLGFDAQQGDNQ
jgi:hypothetical protein